MAGVVSGVLSAIGVLVGVHELGIVLGAIVAFALLCGHIPGHARRDNPPWPSSPPARHLLRAKDLADARYFEPLDVDDLARAAGLSRAHFSREFRRAFGESPHAYLLTRRLERAAALLRNTDRSVAEICFSVGLQQRRLVHDQLHPHVRHVADRLPRGVPAGRRACARPGLRRARLRAPATPHVSRRQRPSARR